MHHPIQMKPADSEKNNGKDLTSSSLLYYSLPFSSCIQTDTDVLMLGMNRMNDYSSTFQSLEGPISILAQLLEDMVLN